MIKVISIVRRPENEIFLKELARMFLRVHFEDLIKEKRELQAKRFLNPEEKKRLEKIKDFLSREFIRLLAHLKAAWWLYPSEEKKDIIYRYIVKRTGFLLKSIEKVILSSDRTDILDLRTSLFDILSPEQKIFFDYVFSEILSKPINEEKMEEIKRELFRVREQLQEKEFYTMEDFLSWIKNEFPLIYSLGYTFQD